MSTIYVVQGELASREHTSHCNLLTLSGSVTIRTACSASLVALHSACQALHQGDCSAAIVAGANLILSPTNTSGLAEVGALSPDASCKTFDAKANGYARAEGVNALYLKKLSDAVACGDHIRAVIRSTASNSDGRSSSFSNPNPDAHAALMRSAYRRVGLHPAQTGFVEMHGTGTAAGDPIEARAVGEVFGDGGTYIGSVCDALSSMTWAMIDVDLD